MDAVEFLKKGLIMCNSYEACIGCPMEQMDDCCMLSMNLKQMINIVEQWAKEHPIKTRQSEFLKQYPDAEISDDGLPSVAPCQLDVGLIHGKAQKDCEDRGVCDKCRHDFWLKEIE